MGGAVGYTWPIGRRWSLDFTLSVGYIDGKYKKYHPEDDRYIWDADYHRRYFGPTKAEVALVWDIGRDSGSGSRHAKIKVPKRRWKAGKGGGWGW